MCSEVALLREEELMVWRREAIGFNLSISLIQSYFKKLFKEIELKSTKQKYSDQ